MKEKLGCFFSGIGALYLASWQFMAVVFFIDVCKTWDSESMLDILKIIFLGTLWAELKGVLWPFFI